MHDADLGFLHHAMMLLTPAYPTGEVTALLPSLPSGAVLRSSRDGPDRTRRACSEEASSVARGGPPAAACCACTYTPACGEVGWWWIPLPCDAPYARVSRAGAHMRMGGDGAPRRRARRVPHGPTCSCARGNQRTQAGLACGLPQRGLAARGVPAQARRASSVGVPTPRELIVLLPAVGFVCTWRFLVTPG